MAAATSSTVRYCWTDRHGLQTQNTVKRLHTGYNRNDQVATDVRLWLRGKMDLLIDLLVDLQKSLVDVSKQNVEVILHGFTHLQLAQPVSFARHLLAYVEMFPRDAERMSDVRRRTNVAIKASTLLPPVSILTQACFG